MAIIWIVHGVGVLLSIAFITFSIYTACHTSYFSLPIPTFATALAILVSLITYPLLILTRALHLAPKSWQRAFWAKVTPYILLLLNTILLTLSADRLSSSSFQSCSLHEQWLRLFQAKDVRAIRRIQDSMECCGFRTSRDMAWPFPDHENRSRACEVAFGRTVGCEGPWTVEAKKLLGMMVAIGSVGVVCVILSLPGVWEFRGAWFRQTTAAAAAAVRPHPHQTDSNQRLITNTADEDEDEDNEEQPYADDPEQGHEGRQQPQLGGNAATSQWM